MSSRDRIEALARTALAAAAWAFVGCLVVQLFLVGLDVFEVIGSDSPVHRNFAYVYGWLAPLIVLLAGVGRVPRALAAQATALLVLFAVQTYLPTLVDSAPLIAATHAVNALAVFWLALLVARRAQELVGPLTLSGGS